MPWRETSVMEERLCPASGGRRDQRGVPGLRHIAQDWLQDLQSLQAGRPEALTDRSRRPVRYANQLPAQIKTMIIASKKDKPHWDARADQGTPGPQACRRCSHSLDTHGSCGSRSPRAGRPCPQASPQQGRGHGPVPCARPQRSVVCRLQGRVQVGGRSILLPIDGDRPGVTLSSGLGGLLVEQGASRLRGVPPAVCRAPPAGCNPQQQRRTLRQPERPLQSVEGHVLWIWIEREV